jgi:small multidrug resistance pump
VAPGRIIRPLSGVDGISRMGWIYLLVAIACEVVGTTALRQSDGFHRLVPDIIVVVGYAASFLFLSFTLRYMQIGPVYAIWAGIGTAALALIGIFAFDESASPLKLASIALVVIGVVGLNLTGTGR